MAIFHHAIRGFHIRIVIIADKAGIFLPQLQHAGNNRRIIIFTLSGNIFGGFPAFTASLRNIATANTILNQAVVK